jgi:hypothetical protein
MVNYPLSKTVAQYVNDLQSQALSITVVSLSPPNVIVGGNYDNSGLLSQLFFYCLKLNDLPANFNINATNCPDSNELLSNTVTRLPGYVAPTPTPATTYDVTVDDSSNYSSFACNFGNPAGQGGITSYTFASLPTFSSVTASVSDSTIKLAIVQGDPELYFQYEVTTDSGSTWTPVIPTKKSDNNFEVVITGLTNLQQYLVKLRATNSDNWTSEAYNVGSVIPTKPIGAITISNVIRHQSSNTMEIFFNALDLSQSVQPSTLSVTYTLADNSVETKLYDVISLDLISGTMIVALH